MINTERAFNDLGIDAVTGVELMQSLNLSPMDLADQTRFMKLSQTIDYLKKFPLETQQYFIRKATTGKAVDRLTHMWEYSQLLQRKTEYEENLANMKSERALLDDKNEKHLVQALEARAFEARQKLGRVKDELRIYEK